MRGYNENSAIYEEYSLSQLVDWINGYTYNQCARGANLKNADLSGVNLSYANLSGVNLKNANLRNADLSGVNLSGVNLRNADLRGANLSESDLSESDLSGVNLKNADLSESDLRESDLSGVNLSGVNLKNADLSESDLKNADLSGANLSGVNLKNANLSGAKNILSAKQWLMANFDVTEFGFRVYKAIGNTSYSPNNKWEIKEGSLLEEEVNYTKTDACGCGVNFGTMAFISNNYQAAEEVWECCLHYEDLCLLCVPYNTDGKARCGRLQLIRRVR
jgi:hypothetical protein